MADGGTLQDLARMLRQLKRRDARRRGGTEVTYRALAARTGWSTGIINAHLEGAVLQNLGETLLASGDEDAALHHFGLALAIRRRIGEKRREADTSNAIGLLRLSRGEHASALDHFGRALALSREIDDRRLQEATLANMALLG